MHRSVAQIDFVPTLSLLLGLPIPFNSLGSIIPEMFPGTLLTRALRINAFQIRRYLSSYARQSPEFSRFSVELDTAWNHAMRADFALAKASTDQVLSATTAKAYAAFNRLALRRAKEVWARFDYFYIGTGLIILATSLGALTLTRSRLTRTGRAVSDLDEAFSCLRVSVALGSIGGAVLGFGGTASVYFMGLVPALLPTMKHSWLALLLGAITIGANVGAIVGMVHQSSLTIPYSGVAAITFLHAALMGSNSFIVWEDSAVQLFFPVVLLVLGARAIRTRQPASRVKNGFLTLVAIVASRIIGSIRVCREEQAPYCETTFYTRLASSQAGNSPSATSSSGTTLNSIWGSVASYALAMFAPQAITWILTLAGSRTRLVDMLLKWIVRPCLMMGSGYWLLDTLVSYESIHHNDQIALKMASWAKLALARIDICIVLGAIVIIWPSIPLPLEVKIEEQSVTPASPSTSPDTPPQRATIVGLRNVMGSSWFLQVCFVFALQFLVTQPMGQISLALSMAVLLCISELGASSRSLISADGELDRHHQVSAWEVLSVGLLGHLTFFGTGHQAAIPSIQWRTAFVGFTQVVHPFSGMLVALNSFGPLTLLPAVGVVLLVLWQSAPRPRGTTSGPMATINNLIHAALTLILWQTVMTLASAVLATHFRRHLMLFKIWAPRFMLGGVSLIGLQIAIIISCIGAGWIMSKVASTIGTDFSEPSD